MGALTATTTVRTSSDYVDQVGQSADSVFAPVLKAAFAAAGFEAGAYDAFVHVAAELSADHLALVVRVGDPIDAPAPDPAPPMSDEQIARNAANQEELNAELARLAAAHEAIATQGVS
jgi:hypothetical protein